MLIFFEANFLHAQIHAYTMSVKVHSGPVWLEEGVGDVETVGEY